MKATLIIRHIILLFVLIVWGAGKAQAVADEPYENVTFPM